LLLSLYDHTILLTRLLSWFGFQFHGIVINWFFFHCSSHHAPSVLNMAALSSSQTSSYGVSQGSVLGPLLFIMYTAPWLITLALSLMNISLIKSQHFLNPAILLFVHFVVSVLDEEKQPVPSPHPLSILNLTTATPFYHNLPNS